MRRAICNTLEMDARSLLSIAKAQFDSTDELSTRARLAWRGGFASGAAWMRCALGRLRNNPLPVQVRAYQVYGSVKYGLATAAALLFAAAAIGAGWPVIALGGALIFYWVEARMVFLFPLLLDGSPRPWRDSLHWTRQAGGTVKVMRTVMRLAATMIFGGAVGGGFVRSWCVGCLAVCIWYERLRMSTSGQYLSSRPKRFDRVRGMRGALEVGNARPLHVRTERLEGWGLPRPLRIVYISDLHLGRPWTRGVAGQAIRAARRARAEVILLGGDLLENAGGQCLLGHCVAALARLAPVYAVAGNHDLRAGLGSIRDTIILAGGKWLMEPVLISDGHIELISSIGGGPPSHPTILCAHDPSIFPSAVQGAVDLVFAGHLHGGQCVLFQRGGKLYPGAWLAKWTGLRFVVGRSTLLVSRGAADTLPIRWNCPREVILCEIS
jgi:predicted MPP superfamily phosphohydrolase